MITFLLVADEVVLLTSLGCDMKMVVCPLLVGYEVMPQAEEVKYLEDLFMSEGRREQLIDRWTGAASTV